MKQKYVPLEKRSKREQREHHAARRGSWGEVNPVTRKAPDPKVYNRKKSGRWLEHEPVSGFYFFVIISPFCLWMLFSCIKPLTNERGYITAFFPMTVPGFRTALQPTST